MTWREKAAPIIAEVLCETAGKPEADIRKALREAYPFGPREYFPYKVWCDEVRRQRGLKQRKRDAASGQACLFDDVPGQCDLFDDEK